MAGCRGKPTPAAPPATKPAKSPPAIKVVSTAGSSEWYSQGPNRSLLWNVFWKSADITTVGYLPTIGEMRGVHGEIGPVETKKNFHADQALADKAKNTLTLSGNVAVEYPKNEARMKCDKLVYDANLKRFDAKGNVSLVSKNMEVKGVPELMADSSFNQIASPDLFEEKK